MSKITKEEIKTLVLQKELTITDVIDVVVELNGFIGVGLVSLGQQLHEHCIFKLRNTHEK